MNIKNLLFYTILTVFGGQLVAQEGIISNPSGTPIPN